MNSVYVALIKTFFFFLNKHEITQNISDFCNHDNQIKQPSAILQKVTCSNDNIFLQTKVYMNNVYIA